ncbi:MAG TPA: BTAD domain-containing putative transcriptional regulator [Mycobacteriales bacterium]|nr:BTAD domain-containing putative transcriptional regulator [Mycobacteriales bacterium]
MTEFRVLGPVQVWAAGQPVDAGQPRQRGVLAALLIDAGRLVTTETLIDRVWGAAPPARARDALYPNITRIRRVLSEASCRGNQPAPLVRSTGGYLLDIDPDRVDLHRVRRLVDQARDPGSAGAQRVLALRESLALSGGEALVGVAGDWAARTREAWQQEHLQVVVAWAEAELRVGNPAAVIATGTDLAGAHPLAEPLAAVLMRALHAAGRRADALDQFTRIRRRLAEELGTDPGPQLLAVHQGVLRGELDPVPADPPTAPARATPAMLPADVYGFAGRSDELARLDATLTAAAAEAPMAVVITAVSGTAGVGKTALAVHWAHRVADRYPDGQLHVNLRGFDPGGQVVEPAAAVRGFLDALGVPPDRVPAQFDAQVGLYRSLLAGKRVLVVIDNARDAGHARPLLPGSPTALAVVTSRDSLADLVAADGAHPLALDLLTEAESWELLERRLGPGRVAAEPDAVARIVAVCAGLPLALALVAARAATHPGFRLEAVATELADAAGQAPALADAGDVIGRVRAVFSWSYTTLTPPAARLFRLLGLHPGPDTTAAAAASLAGVSLAHARPLLAELTRAGLLAEHVPGRYGFHDLLAAYATHLTDTVDTDREREAATVRLLDHYVHTAHSADRQLSPARDPIQVPLAPPTPGVTPEQPIDEQAAIVWLDAERPVLLAAQQRAAAAGRDAHAWQLAWALDTVLHRRGHWHEAAGAWQTTLPAAGRLPHSAAATVHRRLGQAMARLGDDGQAHTHLRHALHLDTRAADPVGQAYTHRALGYLWERRGRPDRALDHAQQALTLYQATGHRLGQAHGLNAVGWDHGLLGDHTRARTYCQQALTLFQQVGDRDGEAGAWDSLGYANHHLGHHTQAVDCYRHALTLVRGLGDRYLEATALTHLGDSQHAAGQPDQARAAWTAALDILTDLDHPDADAVRAKLATLDQPAPKPEDDR